MKLRLLLLVSTLSVTGCAVLDSRQANQAPLVNPPASAAEAISIARAQAKRGRWADALEMLHTAQRSFPDAASLEGELSRMQRRRDDAMRLWRDELLLSDAENQKTKIDLLGKLSQAEPDNLILTSRRLYWKELLEAKTEKLLACSEFHLKSAPTLAKRCFELARVLSDGDAADARLAEVDVQLRSNETAKVKKRRANQQKERRLRAKVLLGNARAAIDGHDYRRALDILDDIAKLQPDNPEVTTLQQEAWAMIGPQVEALVKLGDHLYLDEQLDAAVATWQAALNLKPEDADIVARIDRAQTVLERLDTLRKEQSSSEQRSVN